jgi:hypothetical protein
MPTPAGTAFDVIVVGARGFGDLIDGCSDPDMICIELAH